MLQLLHTETVSFDGQEWLQDYFKDFRRRFMSLLSYQFKAFTPALALSILLNKNWIPGKFKGLLLYKVCNFCRQEFNVRNILF